MDRNSAIYEIEKTINQYGFITDFHMYSDIDICLTIELNLKNICSLHSRLQSLVNLNNCENVTSFAKEKAIIRLNITFTAGTGKLRVEVPAVPG